MMLVFATILLTGCSKTPEEDPLSGPGFDESTGAFLGEADQYLVSITHLQVKNAPGPGGRFGDHASAVGNHLFDNEPEGWMGAGFRNVGRLQWWTLTVWESEEALLGFVTTEPHLSAMTDIHEVSVGSRLRSLWMDKSALPLEWPDALTLLAAEADVEHGNAKWPEE